MAKTQLQALYEAKLSRHIFHTCDSEWCHTCINNLKECSTCGGIGYSLTSDCAGRLLTKEELEAVRNKLIDFVDNKWVEEN